MSNTTLISLPSKPLENLKTQSPSLNPIFVQFQPFGRTFQTLFGEKQKEKKVEEKKKVKVDEDSDDEGPITEDDYDDYYKLLGLSKYGYKATLKQIKDKYKKKTVQYHPDRNMGESKLKNGLPDDGAFKAVQSAWACLSNEKHRVLYDSDIDFDLRCPSVPQKEASFYKVFGRCFKRWSRWSKASLREFGDEKTPWVQVEKFYSEWRKFKSWRNFSFKGEHNLTEAVNRGEEKWMQRENEKIGKKFKKTETQSFFAILDLAKKNDPRVKKRNREIIRERKEREQKKRDELLRKQEEADRIRREEEERIKKIEDEKKRKKKAEKDAARKKKQLYDRLKNEVRGLLADYLAFGPLTHVTIDDQKIPRIKGEDLEWILFRVTHEELVALVKRLKDTQAEGGYAALYKLFSGLKQEILDTREREKKQREKEEEDKKIAKKEAKKRKIEWSSAELSILAKGIRDFPGGSAQRWENIANLLKEKTAKQVRDKTMELKKAGKVDRKESEHFKDFNEKTRGSKNVSKEQLEKASDFTKNYDSKVWTKEEQKKFEVSFRKFAKVTDKWEKIAETLEGRTVSDVKARYKYCREMAMKKKKKSKKKKQ